MQARWRLSEIGPIQLLLAAFAALVPVATLPESFDSVAIPRLGVTSAATGLAIIALAASRPGLVVAGRDRWVLLLALWSISISAFAASQGADPVGSMLGELHRYQGVLPGIVYLALMGAAAVGTRRAGTARHLLWGLFAGACLSAGYVALDVAGLGWVTWHGVPTNRALGLFGQPNVLAIQLVCGLAAGAPLWRDAGPRSRDALMLGGAATAGALVLTLSRAGWVAALAGALAFAWLTRSPMPPRRWIAATLAAVALAATALVLVTPGFSKHLSERTSELKEESTRVGLWRLGLEMFADEPVTGSGADSFPVLFPEYRHERQAGIGWANIRAESSHNLLIDRLVDTGVLGSACFLGLMAVIATPAVRAARNRGSFELAGLVTICVAYYTATAFSFAEAMTGWIPWLALGAMLGLCGGQRVAEVARWRPALTAGLTGAGMAAIVGGSVLIAADLRAGQAQDQLLVGDPAGYATAEDATTWNPLLRNYLELRALIATEGGDDSAAQRDFHRLNSVFTPTADSLLGEAEALLAMGPRGEYDAAIMSLLQQAQNLDPFNEPRTKRAVALLNAMKRP